MARTLKFLASIQASDGSFYETRAKLAHSPQRWLQEEALIDRFYFTAAVAMRLFSLNCSEHPLIEPALEWLGRRWTDWELLTGTWYNLWTFLCLYSEDVGLSTSRYERCRERALSWLPDLKAQPLAWMLDALHGARFSSDDALVVKGLARLRVLQTDDGVWPDRRYSTVETTVTALRLFHDYEAEPGA
jgi:hypothetical protein